ncbi:zinc dependent phospholipase C family protein [Clostridium sp. D2Q-14]|uniref:zinc dependent phospholipase C family protein n=1 Tax=Anaeromonas gelatinilytica TaxID=2683194 RepID=UPI00193B754C|nr:zinc dependent phospholipase C family protein [Anaeromonas gelatinilytica]MBS4534605.1 zinc dependent phospholipase C family protein [Anaeromonas gelatinilytica]
MKNFEKYYGKAFKSILWILNPFKKKIIKTECQVHRFINYQALKLLANNDYMKEFELYNHYLEEMNRGVVWADQDFKSINHFYSLVKRRGMFGHLNARILTRRYYKKALFYWEKGYKSRSMFFLGATVHIIQDMTIPQHVNIRLLDSHRQYENFVKLTYDIVKEFRTNEKPIKFKKLDSYVKFNGKIALKTYAKYKNINNSREKYYKITKCALPLAQRTTAGCMLMFLRDLKTP